MNHRYVLFGGLLAGLCAPAFAAVSVSTVRASVSSPQPIGTSITFTATATDSNPGPLTFQFNVAAPHSSFALASDFNAGTLAGGVWSSLPLVWTPTGIEGAYQIQVVVKDFVSGESASRIVRFQVKPLVTGSSPVVVATANPLVALFSAPACPAGSGMRVRFQAQFKQTPFALTNSLPCHPPYSMTFEIAGMYPNTAYVMSSETITGGKITRGPVVSFKTGQLPADIPFPQFTVNVGPGPATDTADPLLLVNPHQFGNGLIYANVATDLKGNIMWYYYASPPQDIIMGRPLHGGTMLTIQSGPAWIPNSIKKQLLRQIDLAGNIIKETNTGAIQQQLLAMGAADGGPCDAIPSPAPVGSGCLDDFHHDVIQSLPGGYTALLAAIEKIYPPGTQGDTSGLPVDVIGDMIVVLDANWKVVWYFDSFQHASGGGQLDIHRAAVLGETCTLKQQGCPNMYLLGPGISTEAPDWLHGNSLYYWPQDHDLLFSARNQDWVMKIDYNDGAGSGNILWRMGPCGDFTFENTYNDPWPWFSAQHEAAIENGGAGPLDLFDNGNTRVSPPSGPGSSTGCMPGVGSGNSRGMALTIDETSLEVTPVLSVDLGKFSNSGGNAQLLSDGNYYFYAAVVLVNLNTEDSFSIEIQPTAGAAGGTQALNVATIEGYRGWQMHSLYDPPLT
jgi:arylsulfate sulfotransferase